MEVYDAIVDCFVGTRVSIGVCVAAQSVFGFDDDDGLAGVGKADSAVGTRGAAAYDADVAGDDCGGGVGCRVYFGRGGGYEV